MHKQQQNTTNRKTSSKLEEGCDQNLCRDGQAAAENSDGWCHCVTQCIYEGTMQKVRNYRSHSLELIRIIKRKHFDFICNVMQ